MKNTIRILVVLLALASLAGAQTMTVEKIFGKPGYFTPLPREFRFDPAGGRLLYLQPKGEETPLMAMDLKTREQKPLLDSAALSKLTKKEKARLAGFEILKNGKFLLTLDSGTWLYTSSGEMTQLLDAEAEEVLPSPDGSALAFVRKSNVCILDIATKAETQITNDGKESSFYGSVDWVYREELDLSAGMFWSDDGKQLGFLQFDEARVDGFPIPDFIPVKPEINWEKYPKAGAPNPALTLWLHDLNTRKTRMLMNTASDEYLARVNFTPDGRTLFLQMLDRGQNTLTLAALNPATGERRTILQEKDSAWINVHDNLVFLKTRPEFLWTSERNGWSHLYLCSLDGKSVKPLTSGEFEVTQVVGLDAKESNVYFMSSEKDRRDRQLYRLSLADGKRTPLTTASGVHSDTVSPDGQYFVDTASNITTPTQIWLHTAGQDDVVKLADSASPDFKALQMPRVEPMVVDGCDAVLLKPSDFDPAKKYPVLIEVYGGPHAQTTLNAWGRGTYLFHAMLAQKGYLVFWLDNRGAAGRGHAWEAELLMRFGQKELEDQLKGVAWLKKQAFVDPARIGIWGWSYGGFMTLFALTHSKEFKTGVAVAPVTDWHYYDSIYTERYLKLPRDNEQGYKDSSPVNFVKDLNGKLLLVHGSGDDNVHFQNSMAFINEMIKYDKPYQFLLYPNRTHGIHDEKARIHLFSAIQKFVEENL